VRFDFLKRDLLFMSDDAQRDQTAALVRITPNLRAVLAAHVALQLMDRRCLRSAHDVDGNSLIRVAAKAFHFEVAVTSVESIAERRRRLRRPLKTEHSFVPRLDGKPVGGLPRLGSPHSAEARIDAP
jgi:hypothetical protein